MTPSYSLGDPTPRHGRKWHQSSLPSANMVSPKGIVSSTSTQRVDIISHTYTYYMYIYYVYVYIYLYIIYVPICQAKWRQEEYVSLNPVSVLPPFFASSLPQRSPTEAAQIVSGPAPQCGKSHRGWNVKTNKTTKTLKTNILHIFRLLCEYGQDWTRHCFFIRVS